MEVGSWVHATTLVVGWKYYELLWDLLVATGIVFLPIVALLINTFIEARRRASLGYIGTDNVLSEFEGKLMVLFLVFFLCSMPSAVNFSGQDIRLYSSANNLLTDAAPTPEVQPACSLSNSTATTTQPVSGATDMCQDNVNIPLWWYATQSFSQGVAMAVVKETAGENDNAYRAVLKLKHMAKFKDPTNRNLLAILQNECMVEARSNWKNDTAGASVNEPNSQGTDISWVGADVFVNTYYADIETNSNVPMMGVNAVLENTREVGYAGATTSRQNCSDLWDFFRVRAQQEADQDSGFTTKLLAGLGNNNAQTDIIKAYVKGTIVGESSTTEELRKMRKGDNEGLASKAFGILTGGFAVYEMTKMVVKTNMYVDVMIVALPMLQAYLLMFICMALPIGFIVSQYSFKFVISATVLIFSISFWPALWAIVAWLDNTLAEQLYPAGNTLGALWDYLQAERSLDAASESITSLITMLSHNLVTMSMYIFAPIAFSWVMSTAGFGEALTAAGTAAGGIGGRMGGVPSGGVAASKALRSNPIKSFKSNKKKS